MFLVFDIGGTKTRIAVSSDGKKLGEIKTISTAKNFLDAVSLFQKTAFNLTKEEPIEMAVGGVRALDKTKTKLLNQPHFPLWVDEPLKKKLEEALKTKVILENDAAMAGLGEAVFGAGKEYAIVAYLTIGTGVGGARIVDKRIDKSSQGFEPGNQIINLDGRTLESYISGEAVERIYGKKAKDLEDPKIWEKVAKYLAIGLNNVTVFWSPEVIVLGGAVMQSIPLDHVRAYFKKNVTIFPTPPEIIPAKLGDSVTLYGALQLLSQT